MAGQQITGNNEKSGCEKTVTWSIPYDTTIAGDFLYG